MNEQEVVALMESSQSAREWDANCDKVKKACGGYPAFWWQTIIKSGLGDRVMSRWGEDTQIRIVSGAFTSSPRKPRAEFPHGTVLLPLAIPLAPGAESGLDFVRALGGDENTIIGLGSVDQDGIITGIPLGKDQMVRPPFVPSWDADQLQGEIDAGAWRCVRPGDPDHETMSGEARRRAEEVIKMVLGRKA